MAFDQNTRNRLQRFVTDARRSLEEEFTRQLQNDYGLDPVSGTASPLESLRHINDQQRETARILRDTLAHYCASSDTDTQAGLDRIVREQAFTVLNRLAALRMAEARGLLIESVGIGYQAKGFRLYARLAGTGLGETGDAYRAYLQSVFDEFALDLPGLFDRFSPQGRLFPREAALIQVLALINHGEIEPLWAEDETIGWIYQYFNSKEERKAMRDASQAPRNSRELAVRNQFFTPRYVVEFLVDNTLGRLWFNWTGGRTELRDRCQYLLVKPDEKPQAAKRLRDPRTIKLLDPACGSMHFGLYAFDLFQEIYREAWEWEQTRGPGALDRETGGSPDLKPLSETYADQDAFLKDAPRLVIEHNIYGVDIDPRAAQIASLALWLRAQRAWHEAGVKAKDRPQVGQGHVVAAVAPPAEVDQRKRFMEELDPLDAELFEQTLFMLKGLPELGMLLQVEKELPALIRKVFGEHGDLFRDDDMAQWQKAEARLREALTDYTRAARSTYQGRLFAEDALQGLRMIDHCREVFDVVVMNPPFGDPSESSSEYLDEHFGSERSDLDAIFVTRAHELLSDDSRFGGIFNRTQFFKGYLEPWRDQNLFGARQLAVCADLGYGVLDGAVVEAACYTTSGPRKDAKIRIINALAHVDKESAVISAIRDQSEGSSFTYSLPLEDFLLIPGHRLSYRISEGLLEVLKSEPRLEGNYAFARQGLITSDNYRFLRLMWEINPEKIGIDEDQFNDTLDKSGRKWAPYVKGGDYSPYYQDTHLTVNWANSGKEIKSFFRDGKLASRPQNLQFYFLPGLTYTERTASNLSVRAMPTGCIFDCKGPAIIPSKDDTDPLALLAITNSRVFSYFVELSLAAGDSSTSGTAARQYTQSIVGNVPVPECFIEASKDLAILALEIWKDHYRREREDESSPYFLFPSILAHGTERNIDAIHRVNRILERTWQIEKIVSNIYVLSEDSLRQVEDVCGKHPIEYESGSLDLKTTEALLRLHKMGVGAAVEELLQSGSAERFITKNMFYADRMIELLCHAFRAHPSAIIEAIELDVGRGEAASLPNPLLSWAVGVAFGRFDWRLATGERDAPPELDPFDPLPAKSPGMLPEGAAPFHDHNGILVDDQGHPHDLSRLIEEVLARVDAEVPGDVRRWLQRDFFPLHLKQYSKSRRKAPIYWPLSTSSGSYTLWLYYPSLTRQTLYTAVNDFVEPKLKQVSRDTAALRDKGTVRSRDDEKAFEALQTLELELIELRDTLLQIAPNYRPNHDDGVQITAAPLWQLFRHKPWQKILKDTWTKLEKGDYDWAHLAMAYWPDRVREKCKTDKSLAIAHDLEHLYVEPEPKAAKTRGRKKSGGA